MGIPLRQQIRVGAYILKQGSWGATGILWC